MARPHSSYGAPLDDYSPRQGQQHIINMGGIDGAGAGAGAGAYRATQRSPLMAAAAAAASPGSAGMAAYASPRLPQHGAAGLAPLPPAGSTGQSSLSRSQSLGHHVYQQHQQAQQQQQQQYAQHASSPGQSHHAAARGSYHRSRESAQPSYSDGSGGSYGTGQAGSSSSRSSLAGAGGGGSLLPTINTQIPSGNFASSPYSPSGRNSIFAESSSSAYSAQPPMSRSPGHSKAGGGSPYAPAQAAFSSGSQFASSQQQPGSQHRPLSMLESGTYSNFRDRPGTSPAQHEGARLAHRTSNTALRSSAYDGGLPTYHTPSQPGDSLPYAYSTSALASAAAGLGQTGHAPPPLSAGGPPPRGSALYASEKDRRGSMPASTSTGYDRDWQQQQHQPQQQQQPLQQQHPQAQQGSSKMPQRPVPQVGFRRVRDTNDLRPNAQAAAQGFGRRADPAGGHVSPLKAMTTYLHHTYHLVNPAFFYELSFNPRRVLTKPSKPMHNDGHDNEDSDYILYVNDWLGAEEGNRYLILDVLGQGTFGQVVKCQNMKTHEIVAVKVIKNKPAYFHQSMMEVTILEMLNGSWDPNDEHHILRLRDTFIHAKHLCLVFELLSSNLYELIKQNSFRGLSTSLVRVFTAQLLDALTVLHEARLIHCDLKPENILLKTLQTPSIKLVDFGSACHERQTVYTYIQSRFYRSPEVLLGLPYSASIDMWSLGCIAVELFLGLPLFPGTSEYNQICRIVEMLGLPPAFMLDQGKQTGEFFSVHSDEYGRKTYRLKSLEQYSKEHNTQEQPSKKYFQATTLPEIIKTYPMPRKSGRPADVPKEMASRTCFIDFVTGLLNMDPAQRWTPQQARKHPFITNEKFVEPYKPAPNPTSPTSTARTTKAANATVEAAKHPYGGLPQTPSRGSGRAYPDAAAYNQHLAQQQAYNSAHQARQSQPPPVNNPYAQDAQAQAQAQAKAHAQAQQQHQQQQAQAHAQAQAQAQAAAAHHAAVSPQGYAAQPANATGVQTRSRSNTMTRMDTVPPQLAKLGLDSTPHSGANLHSATPVLTREESLREWERRQQQNGGSAPMPQQMAAGAGATGSGKARTSSNYGHLDLLQHGSGATGWSQQWSGAGSSAQRHSSQGQPSAYTSPSGSAIHSPPGGQPPGAFSVIVDGQDRRMVNPHDAMSASAAMANMSTHGPGGMSSITQPPPAAYAAASSGPSQASRYQPPAASSTYGAAGMSFDPYDTGIAQLMPALKPTQYQGSQAGAATQRHSVAVMPGAGSSYGGLQPVNTAASPSGLRGDDGFGMQGFDGRRYSQQQHPQMQQQHPPAASPQGHQRF